MFRRVTPEGTFKWRSSDLQRLRSRCWGLWRLVCGWGKREPLSLSDLPPCLLVWGINSCHHARLPDEKYLESLSWESHGVRKELQQLTSTISHCSILFPLNRSFFSLFCCFPFSSTLPFWHTHTHSLFSSPYLLEQTSVPSFRLRKVCASRAREEAVLRIGHVHNLASMRNPLLALPLQASSTRKQNSATKRSFLKLSRGGWYLLWLNKSITDFDCETGQC